MTSQLVFGEAPTDPLERMAHGYAQAFKKYPPLHVANGWLYGYWVIGRAWGEKTDQSIYGAYPGNYLPRVMSMFPDVSPQRTLHIFAGRSKHRKGYGGGVCVDLDIAREPSVVADVTHLPFGDGVTFDLVLADPPYSKADAKNYGFKMIDRKEVFYQVRRFVAPGGYMVWLDTIRPMYQAKQWEQVGIIGVVVGANTRVRSVSIYRARPDYVWKPREKKTRTEKIQNL